MQLSTLALLKVLCRQKGMVYTIVDNPLNNMVKSLEISNRLLPGGKILVYPILHNIIKQHSHIGSLLCFRHCQSCALSLNPTSSTVTINRTAISLRPTSISNSKKAGYHHTCSWLSWLQLEDFRPICTSMASNSSRRKLTPGSLGRKSLKSRSQMTMPSISQSFKPRTYLL